MADRPKQNPDIAVVIPCYQEARPIAKVVADFRREMPDANIYVFDNNCTDGTSEIAAKAGAIVIREKHQGKGFGVASMFDPWTRTSWWLGLGLILNRINLRLLEFEKLVVKAPRSCNEN